jgi:hypothetical protein
MLTLIHGGQTGVDRGAHYAAIDNGWLVAGYMPSNARDEYGPIPPEVARCLRAHGSDRYAARTQANVMCCDALLVVVRNKTTPRVTPGTATTLDLAADRHLLQKVVDPNDAPGMIARWIWCDLLALKQLPLLLEAQANPLPTRLMVAGPRESKWPGACAATAGLLRQVGHVLRGLSSGQVKP